MYLSTMYLSTMYLSTKIYINQVYRARYRKIENHDGGVIVSQSKDLRSGTKLQRPDRQPSARVVGHYLVGEEFDGPHGLLMGQIAPLEGADEVVGPGGDVLIQVSSNGFGRARNRTEPGG